MIRDAAGNHHTETPLEQAALCVLWAEGRGVKMSVDRGRLDVDTTDADITPLTDDEFEGWVRSVAREIGQILIARRQPTTVH